jgi:hypothetical protein
MNRLIKLEELQEGDEIIISAYSNLKYLKVLKTPTISKTKKNWKTGIPLFSAVRCSIRQDKYENPHETKTFKKKYVFEQDISKHNHKINIDLEYRDIYLVKREKPKKEGIYE